MAIFRGLNTGLYLGDVDNLNTALNNLGLSINDLNRIRGLADSITTGELHLLGGLQSDQEKETYSAYRSSFAVNQDLSTLIDIYSSAPYQGTIHVNNQVRASALKYNFIQYDESASGYEIKSADISTSRVSSWSNINNTIFYGSEVELNPSIGGGNFADNTESVIRADRFLFKGNITAKRFDAEEPTDKVILNVNGTDYEFFAMRNIPVSFEGFFRDTFIVHATDEQSSPPTIVLVDYATDPASEYEFEVSHLDAREYRTFRTGRKSIDFYYRPDGILQLEIEKSNISNFPTTLANLNVLNLKQNAFIEMPDFATLAPSLTRLTMSGNALSVSGIAAATQMLNLPTTLEQLFIDGTYTDQSTINIDYLTNLTRFNFNSYWDNNNIRRSTDTGVSPIVTNSVVTYNVIDQSFRFVPYEFSTNAASLRTFNLFNNNILGQRNSANTATQDITFSNPLSLEYIDLGKNSTQPILVRGFSSLVTYNHNDNFSRANRNITYYFSDLGTQLPDIDDYNSALSLRFVDFSNSFVTGDIDDLFLGLKSLTNANFLNTRLSGNFSKLAFAGKNLEVFDLLGRQPYTEVLMPDLAQLTITKGLFQTAVDTNTNFWGNDLVPVQVAEGNNLYNLFIARSSENSDGDNSTNTTSIQAYKNGEGFNLTSSDDNNNAVIFESTFASFFTGMSSTNVIGPMEFDSIVLGDISLNSFDNNNGRILLSDPYNTYAISNRRSDFFGAVAVLKPNGALQDTLVPPSVQFSYSGDANKNSGFGEYLAINSQRMYVAFTGRKYNWQNRVNGSVEIYNWNGNHRATINGVRINKRFGQLLTASENNIWCCDNDRDILWAFDINGGNRAEVLNSNNVGNRRITRIKYYNDFLYVSAIGKDQNTNGVVWKINPSTNAIVYTYEPQPDANTFNDIVEFSYYEIDEVEFSKYKQNFGFTFDVTEYTAANAEIIAISSYTDEVIRTPASVTYAATDNEISSLEFVNGDQIRVTFSSSYREEAVIPYKEITEADDNATIVVNYIDDNGNTQSITTDLDKGLSDFSLSNYTIDIDMATNWPSDVNTIVSFTMDVDRIDYVAPGAAVEVRNVDDRQTANNRSITVPSAANRTLFNSQFSRAQNLYLAPRIANSATKEIELIIASSYDLRTIVSSNSLGKEPDGTSKYFIGFDSDLPFIELSGSTSNSYEGKNTESYLFNSFAIFEDQEDQGSSEVFRVMPTLDKLKIGDNDGIAGKLPNLQYLTSITSLELFKTSLQGTVDINQLGALVDCKLNNNKFSGEFPNTSLSNCKLLYINGNTFTKLGKLTMPALEYFDASQNTIEGTLPSFDECLAVKDVNVSSNLFNAYQAESFDKCTSLRKLDVSNCLFTLSDAFRILDDMEANYNLNNRSGVLINMSGNAGITLAQVQQNGTYAEKLAFLSNVANWTIIVE